MVIKPVSNSFLKTTPKNFDFDKLRQEAFANILGQSDKDYFMLRHTAENKSTQTSQKAIQASKNFFESSLSILKKFAKV